MNLQFQHPRKEIVQLAVGLSWGIDGSLYLEKKDGCCEFLPAGNSILGGERMKDGSYHAWTCMVFDGKDVRGECAVNRIQMRNEICQRNQILTVPVFADGGNLLETVLRAGGEGVCRFLPHATYYDAMTACKRLQTWRCVVTALNLATGGASITDAATGEARGTVPLRNRAARCRVGSIIKVEGLGLHAGGKVRDPRPCRDTENSWLIQF